MPARRHSSLTPQTLTAKLAPPVQLLPTRIFRRLRHAVSPVPCWEPRRSAILRGVRPLVRLHVCVVRLPERGQWEVLRRLRQITHALTHARRVATRFEQPEAELKELEGW